MATSSLFHHFVIEGEENVRRFIDAYEATLDAPVIPSTIRQITDPEDRREIFARMHDKFAAKSQEAKNNGR